MQLLLDIPKAGRKKKKPQITHSSVFYGMRGDWSIFWNAADQAYCSAYTDRQTDRHMRKHTGVHMSPSYRHETRQHPAAPDLSG